MFSIGYLEVLFAVLCYIIIAIFLHSRSNSNGLPKAWPVVGMLPEFFLHTDDFFEWGTRVLEMSNRNFMVTGLLLSNSARFLFTADPANVHFIMSTDFGNFPKGPEFKRIFNIFGNGIFNVDFDMWKAQRRMAERLLIHMNYHRLLMMMTRDKLKNGLTKLFDEFCERGVEVDLQDVFVRLTFDLTCRTVTGFDPGRLSTDFPEASYSKAMSDAEEVIFYRHIFPEWSWKLPSILGIGMDAKFTRAWKTMDKIIWGYIEAKRKEKEGALKEGNVDLMTLYMLENAKSNAERDDRFIRDTTFNFLFAGAQGSGAALMWVFWCLSKNPSVERKVREEVDSAMLEDRENDLEKLINRMVYLHGAVCETLRLYPPVPFQHKCPLSPVVLPSGHHVDPKTKILISVYSMGRMKSIWGEDCIEFKPERWISEQGRIKHQPSYKFFTFHTGPRACLGKDIAISQLKMIVAFIIHNYEVHVVEGQREVLSNSILLRMRNGLMAKVTKRNA